jgi:bifunctional UDP-N-acetylglucosamine pyrophosphorylase/glucosamine-1-phosphate N-acetyltransferase
VSAPPEPHPVPPLWSLVLAAGEGTRMKSPLPKVLHEAMGRPMLAWVLDAARGAGAERQIVVVGFGADEVRSAAGAPDVRFVEQRERLGTGHAVMQARPLLESFGGSLLVLAGDTPLLESRTLARLAAAHRASGAAATVLSARFPDPTGYGRIVRSAGGGVAAIREELDATPAEKAIDEINTGAYCFEARDLLDALGGLRADNAKREYYLTDTIAVLVAAGRKVEAVVAYDYRETLGVNTREALAEADATLRERRVAAGGAGA